MVRSDRGTSTGREGRGREGGGTSAGNACSGTGADVALLRLARRPYHAVEMQRQSPQGVWEVRTTQSSSSLWRIKTLPASPS